MRDLFEKLVFDKSESGGSELRFYDGSNLKTYLLLRGSVLVPDGVSAVGSTGV